MSQPQWKLVYSTDYSALYVDETGEYSPELQIAQGDDNEYEVFRFSLDQCHMVYPDGPMFPQSGFLGSVDGKGEFHEEWFWDDLKSIADTHGTTKRELVKALTSSDPKKLAWAYECIGGHWGFNEFDDYPQKWTGSEMDSWPDPPDYSGYHDCACCSEIIIGGDELCDACHKADCSYRHGSYDCEIPRCEECDERASYYPDHGDFPQHGGSWVPNCEPDECTRSAREGNKPWKA